MQPGIGYIKSPCDSGPSHSLLVPTHTDASEMASYQALLSQLMTPNLKMDPSYKVDEGYSEDTRSQDDLESPMSMEPGSYGALASQTSIGSVLPSDIMALSEADRSGKLRRF